MRKNSIVVVLAALLVILAACEKKEAPDAVGTAQAQKPKIEDPVVIKVNGGEIHASEFQAASESIPEQMRGPLSTPAGKKILGEELVKMKVLEQKGETMGLADEREVASKLAMARANILANATIEKLVTAEKLSPQQIYEKVKSQFEYAKVRQILIPYAGGQVSPKSGQALSESAAKDEADKLVAELRAGADFAAKAKEKSADVTSAANGGEMSEVYRNSVPPELAKPIFSLPLNQVSDPIKTPFGYHIIKVESKSFKEFNDPQVQQALAQPERLLANKIIEDLRGQAKVDFDPKFFPPAAQ
ncbi:MAG: peptidylprolyl isomerase [Acidobacteriota bacterium]